MDLEEKKSKKGLWLAIVFILIIVCGVLAYWYYRKAKDNPKLVYTKVIDNFASSVQKNVDESFKVVFKPYSMEYSVDFKLSGRGDVNKAATILNKLKISGKSEADYKNKYINNELNLLYNSDSILKANTVLLDTNAYLEIPDLYDKALMTQEKELANIWDMFDEEDINTIITELVKIYKDNLVDEYFSIEHENGLTKYILNMNSTDLNNYTEKVNNNIIENEKLISALSNISKMNATELKDMIKNSQEEFEINDYLKIIIVLDGTDLQSIDIDISGAKLEIQKNDEKYNINIFEENNYKTIGYLKSGNQNFELNIEYEDTKLTYSIISKDVKFNFNVNILGAILNISLNGNDKNGKATINFQESSSHVNFTMNVVYKINELNSLEKKNIIKYVNVENLTEEDGTKIMENLYGNEALMQFMDDIQNVGAELDIYKTNKLNY